MANLPADLTVVKDGIMRTFHMMTSADVELLRSAIGTREMGKDYNLIVDGMGTGLAPPSEIDYEQMVGSYMLTDLSVTNAEVSLSSSFDLSASNSFPSVGNQGSQGSCAAWAMTYYCYGYREAADNGWTSAKSGSTSQLLSPAWTYNRVNDNDQGSSMASNGWVIEDWGVPTLATMPYLATDYTSWGNQNAMREAALHRSGTVVTASDYSTNTIKTLLQAGKPVVFALDGYQFGTAFKDNPTAPKIITASEYNGAATPNHAQTIVGWDNSKTEDGEMGAFRVVNSWGTGWGESGYYWITYSAFAEMAMKYTPNYIEDLVDYAPTLTAAWHYDIAPGRDTTFTLKLLNNITGATVASKSLYSRSSFSNGAVPLQPNYIVADISDFASSYSATNCKFSIEFSGGTKMGTISSFRVERYDGGYTPGQATQISPQASGLPKSTSGAITTFMAPYSKLSYADALDSSGITYSSSGAAKWVPEVHQSMNGKDAVQSGDISDNSVSKLSATMTGPTNLEFEWKASSESGDSYSYSLDGVIKASISGLTSWSHVSLAIPSGSHTVEWTFTKGSSISRYDDCAYLDKVYLGSGGSGGSSGTSDTVSPISTLSTSGTQGSAGWFTSAVTVSLSASDQGGISSTTYRLNGGLWQTYAAPFTIGTDGSTAIDYYSKDKAGNVEMSKSYIVRIDRQVPSTNPIVSGYAVTLTSSDGGSGVNASYYRLGSGGIWTRYSAPFVAGQAGQNVVAYYYSVDNAGNIETALSVQVGSVDNVAPSTSTTMTGTLGKNGWYVSSVTLALTATDNIGVKASYYRWQGYSTWTTYSSSIVTYSEGDRVLEYYSTDANGNTEAVKSVHVMIDRIAPSTLMSVSGSKVTLSSSDYRSGVSTIQYRLDGGYWRTYTAPFTVSVSTQARTVEYRATDFAGNVESSKSKTIGPSYQFAATNSDQETAWSDGLGFFGTRSIQGQIGGGDLGGATWCALNGLCLTIGAAFLVVNAKRGRPRSPTDRSETALEEQKEGT